MGPWNKYCYISHGIVIWVYIHMYMPQAEKPLLTITISSVTIHSILSCDLKCQGKDYTDIQQKSWKGPTSQEAVANAWDTEAAVSY